MDSKRTKYCDELEFKDVEDVRFLQDKNADWIQSLKLTDGKYYSPIDICYKEAKFVELFDLQWHYYNVPPSKMNLINTGKSLVLSGEWFGDHPYLKDGPLKGEYVFSQMHFLWNGETLLEGSEHTIDGKRSPLEVHFVHFRKDLLKQEKALKVPGGVVIVVHMYGIAFHQNLILEKFLEQFKNVREANTETCIQPFSMDNILSPFQSDYFVYWGKQRAARCEHIVQWLFPRKMHSVSLDQLRKLKLLMSPNLLSIKRNWRRTPDKTRQTLFLVNSSTRVVGSTLLQIPLKPAFQAIIQQQPSVATGTIRSIADILQILNTMENSRKRKYESIQNDTKEQMQEAKTNLGTKLEEVQVSQKNFYVISSMGLILVLWNS